MTGMTKRRNHVRRLLAGLLFTLPALALSQTNETCLSCHSDPSLTMEKGKRTISLGVDERLYSKSVHREFDCTQCHENFNAEEIPHASPIRPVRCLECHDNVSNTHTFHKTILAPGKDKSALCKDCHGKHDITSPKEANSKFHRSNQLNSCGSCHAAEKQSLLKSSHGKAFAAGNTQAPQCLDCHTTNIVPSGNREDSVKAKLALDKLCLDCHTHRARKNGSGVSAEFFLKYNESVHHSTLAAGNPKAASCVDCHTAHDVTHPSDPTSPMNRLNIAVTCGTCHGDISHTFSESIHGTALAKGNKEAPTCTSCHGEHEILSPSDPRSRVSPLHVSAEVCSPCHGSLRLSTKFGLPGNRIASFEDSFHGLANKAGNTEVANCASCHGVHDIRPSWDPKSAIHKNNIAATCGKCHPGANERFAQGAVHILPTEQESGLVYLVASLYIVLIIVVVGGMTVHNILDFYRKSKRKLMVRRGLLQEEHAGHGLYVRMTLNERLQHGALLVSFITLVLTGFALRFPNAWWVESIRSLSPYMFDIRGIVHRVAAVLLILAGLYHIYYVSFTARGRKLIYDLLPRIQDLREAIAVAKYNLGISPYKPELDRFSYIEKAEYWALVWGTIVMGATGVILWFDNTFLGLIGKEWWDVSHTVHYYEAWLATLAIIVWHFYFVIFNPDVYPINLAFWKGTLTEAEMTHEHPAELRRLKEDERRRVLKQQAEISEKDSKKKSDDKGKESE